MSDQKKSSNITVTGTVTTINSCLLTYILYVIFGVEKRISDEESRSKFLGKNLNILNMEFKRDIFTGFKTKEKNDNDVNEIREVLIAQAKEISELKSDMKKMAASLKNPGEVISPLLVKYSSSTHLPDDISDSVDNGRNTEKIH